MCVGTYGRNCALHARIVTEICLHAVYIVCIQLQCVSQRAASMFEKASSLIHYNFEGICVCRRICSKLRTACAYRDRKVLARLSCNMFSSAVGVSEGCQYAMKSMVFHALGLLGCMWVWSRIFETGHYTHINLIETYFRAVHVAC